MKRHGEMLRHSPLRWKKAKTLNGGVPLSPKRARKMVRRALEAEMRMVERRKEEALREAKDRLVVSLEELGVALKSKWRSLFAVGDIQTPRRIARARG